MCRSDPKPQIKAFLGSWRLVRMTLEMMQRLGRDQVSCGEWLQDVSKP